MELATDFNRFDVVVLAADGGAHFLATDVTAHVAFRVANGPDSAKADGLVRCLPVWERLAAARMGAA